MCDATKCDECGKQSHILQQYEGSWKYICPSCKEKQSKEVTHIVRLDFGEIELKFYVQMVPPDTSLSPVQQTALVLEKALNMAKERGMTVPDENPNSIEIYMDPEYDKD